MYSQQELDEAVAAGVISADAADCLARLHREAAIDRDPPTRSSSGSLPASTTSSSPSPLPSCCSRSAGSVRASASRLGLVDRRATAARSQLPRAARGRGDRMGARAVLHRQAAHGAAVDPAAAGVRRRRASRPPASRSFRPSARTRSTITRPARRASLAAISAAVAAAAAWLHWRRFRVPITVAAGAAAVAGLIVVGLLVASLGRQHREREEPDPRLRAAARHRHVPVRHVVGCVRPRPSNPPLGRRLLAAPAGRADDRRTRSSPCWASTTATATSARAAGRRSAYVLFGVTALAIDRRALLVSALAYVLYALTELFKQFGAVELNVALTALVIGSALLLLSAYLAPGAANDRHAASGEPAGTAAEPRSRDSGQPTSRIRRRSSGARTGPSSCPRFSTTPCSPTKANAPCFSRSSGRFSMRTSGRSQCGERRRRRQHRDRSAAHNRASGRQRPCDHRGRGSASAPCGRKWRLGAGPAGSGTAR